MATSIEDYEIVLGFDGSRCGAEGDCTHSACVFARITNPSPSFTVEPVQGFVDEINALVREFLAGDR